MASNDSQSRYERKKKTEKKDWRENENLVEKDNVGNMENKMKKDTGGARSDKEDLDRGLLFRLWEDKMKTETTHFSLVLFVGPRRRKLQVTKRQ